MNQKKSSGLFSSLKTKLICVLAAICIIPLAIAIIISYINSTGVAKDSAQALNLKQAEYVENDFIGTLNANFRAMEQGAAAFSTRDFVKDATNEAKFNAMVRQLQIMDEKFGDGNSTVVTGADGENLARSKGNFTNIAERGYFKEAMGGKEYVSDVSISKTTGARIIVPAVPIFDDDEKTVLGVLTRNYDVGYLHGILAEEATDGQEIYIMDKEGSVIAISSAELGPEDSIDKSGEEAFKDASSSEEGSFIGTEDGKKKVISFVKEDLTGWIFVVATDYDVIMASSQKAMLIMIIIGVLLAIAAVVVAVIFGSAINKPITAIDDALAALSEGEFRMIEVYTDRTDEFGDMVRNTNSVLGKLSDIVSTIRKISSALNNDASELSDTASQISDTMDDISQAVQEIASGATQQADEIQSATESVGVISNNIEGVTGDADNLASTADAMNTDSKNSQKELQDLERSSGQMADAITRITATIHATSAAVNNISSKVEAIDSIASQTSLLALNASIEAARAGDAGRGFAVVAEEIGKLATDSATSANEIRDEMEKLLGQSQEAVRVAEDVSKSNKAQLETIERTVGAIQNLIDGINTTVGGVESINGNAAACDESKNVIVDAMNNLSAISQENAASTEETSASMQELNATVNNLAHEASQLKEHADTLEDEMKFFKG
ncbi:MAG: methyl-accepting chemotaxis protein [Lachnospiraceae bacterium]|nr:methyl-accepting chemotaxis protein [Lachnospiraceae bacterium]